MSTLYVVATPIGNLKDISERAIATLASSDLIAAEDTRHTLKLLTHYDIRKPLVSYHKFNERSRAESVIQRMIDANISVTLVSDAGTPCISDPGHELVRAAREAGITVIGIPGPSAITTALSVSGFRIDSFAFYGFLPKERIDRERMLERIKKSDAAVAILYEPARSIRELAEMLASVFPGSRACFCDDISKIHEKYYCGAITDVSAALAHDENALLGEYTVILEIGDRAEEPPQPQYCTEALLCDWLVKNGGTLSDAVTAVAVQHRLSKRDVYAASLKLKNLLEKKERE
ncbi:MAG: 16S rRNA (cytidine(1402)-2'-O)-methyltransferase [Spirochaetes bacterium]|nr:16S rRNA (cytidine(1402)-2'-O)-methyltransferase [Spirochaetota bacterium]